MDFDGFRWIWGISRISWNLTVRSWRACPSEVDQDSFFPRKRSFQRGKNYPDQPQMGMPVTIALSDFMKSLKSIKSIEIHRYLPIPTRPLVMSSVQRGCEKKLETWNFHVRTFFHVGNNPETTYNTRNDHTNHRNGPRTDLLVLALFCLKSTIF